MTLKWKKGKKTKTTNKFFLINVPFKIFKSTCSEISIYFFLFFFMLFMALSSLFFTFSFLNFFSFCKSKKSFSLVFESKTKSIFLIIIQTEFYWMIIKIFHSQKYQGPVTKSYIKCFHSSNNGHYLLSNV